MCTAVDNFKQVEERVLQYRSQICQVIRAADVLGWMPGFLSAADEREIKAVDSQSPEKATFLLLKYISMCTESGKWKAFLEALGKADYPYLVSLLDSSQSPEQCVHQRKMLQIFAPYLELQLEPCDIIARLFSSDLIDTRDVEEIQACQRSQGSVCATMLMLDRIQRRQAPSKWYTDFLKILYQKGFKDIVEEMEPEFSLDCEVLKPPKVLVTDSSDSDIDRDEYGYSVEEKIEAKVRYFQSEITELVNMDKIAPALCQLIGIDKFCQIMRHGSSQKESIESMLGEIAKLRSKTRWRSFICCLRDSDYPHLADLLSRPRTSKRQRKERDLLRLFHSTIGEQLEPVDLISHLEKDNVINHRDKEEIIITLQQAGKTAASLVLIDCLQCRLEPRQWFSAFLNALCASGRSDIALTIDPEYSKNNFDDVSGVEKDYFNEANSSEDNDLMDKIDAAHCHIYRLEKCAKQELDKLQKHFDALKSNMCEHIENKTIALTKKVESVMERGQDLGLQLELETSLEQVMSTSYTVCAADYFMNLTKLATLQESENTVQQKHAFDVPNQDDKEYETKRVSIRKRAVLMSRRRCISESSSCSSSSSSFLVVTNSNSLSTSSTVDEVSWKRHASKVRFVDDNAITEKQHNRKIEQEKHYFSLYAMKKTSGRKHTLSESSVLSTDASIVSSTDRAPSSSLTNSLTETSNLSSVTKTSVLEKKVLIERTESYLFHHKKVLNCKGNCILSSVCVLPKNRTVLVDQSNCSLHIYDDTTCTKLDIPGFKNFIPICLCSAGESRLCILFRKRDCFNILVQCTLYTTGVSFVKTVEMSSKCKGKLCSVASAKTSVAAFCFNKHIHVFSANGIEMKIVDCDIDENEWWPNYSVVDMGCDFGFTYDVYSSSAYCFCMSTGKMIWMRNISGVEGITLCGESIYLSVNVLNKIEVLSKLTGEDERIITENVKRPFALSRSIGQDTIIVTQYHLRGKNINRTIKYF